MASGPLGMLSIILFPVIRLKTLLEIFIIGVSRRWFNLAFLLISRIIKIIKIFFTYVVIVILFHLSIQRMGHK